MPRWRNLPLPAGRLVYALVLGTIMHYTYVLKSKVRNYIYVGMTSDIERGLSEHNDGQNKTTRPYRPFDLLLKESYPTRIEARLREKYLKSGVGKEWIKENYIA